MTINVHVIKYSHIICCSNNHVIIEYIFNMYDLRQNRPSPY